jgi:hypothetical protein
LALSASLNPITGQCRIPIEAAQAEWVTAPHDFVALMKKLN